MSASNLEAKILVVDDEKELCSLLKEYFEGRYRVEVAYNGRDALRKLEKFAPDCILLDLKMPQMGGLETLRAVKSSNANAVVIMVTASADLEACEECLSEGAADYILKPVDLEDLERKICSVLRKSL